MRKVIRLDTESRERIVRLLKLRKFLLANRRAKIGRAITILHGFCVCSGFLFVMGFIREGGWYSLAPAIAFVFAGCWLTAQWLIQVQKVDAVKIRIR